MISCNEKTCAIFCHVIDNFGDAGIAWRLALSVTRELHWRTTLIIDDVATLSAFVPEIDPREKEQKTKEINVLRWNSAFEKKEFSVPFVVIEAFSCHLPPSVENAIARQSEKTPVHVFALDYLTAEKYAEESNGLASPHPQYGYPKTFLFPGFSPKTAGLLYESGLQNAFDAFRKENRRNEVLKKLGADPTSPLSLYCFTYPTIPLEDLARALKEDKRETQLILAPGAASDTLKSCLSNVPHIRIVQTPMVDQKTFDEILLSVDIALVRGEDSTTRAQLAGTPLIWTLYPQKDDYQLVKMRAFAPLYTKNLDEERKKLWISLHEGINGHRLRSEDWKAFRDALPAFKKNAMEWSKTLFGASSLTQKLSKIIETRLK